VSYKKVNFRIGTGRLKQQGKLGVKKGTGGKKRSGEEDAAALVLQTVSQPKEERATRERESSFEKKGLKGNFFRTREREPVPPW